MDPRRILDALERNFEWKHTAAMLTHTVLGRYSSDKLSPRILLKLCITHTFYEIHVADGPRSSSYFWRMQPTTDKDIMYSSPSWGSCLMISPSLPSLTMT